MNNTNPQDVLAIRQRHWQELQRNPILLRMSPLIIIGIVIALALTWFMHFLIESTHHELDASPRMQLLDFVRLKREESSERKQLKPEKPSITEAPEAPQQPQQNSDNMNQGQNLGVSMAAPSLSNDFAIDGGGYSIGMNDGDYLPIVKIAPVYPARAARMGFEGVCIVQYTVTTQGTVRDVSVLADQCDHDMFHQVSIDAALKFRYKPRVIDGEAVEVPNVKNRFIFEMQKGN